MQTMIGMTERWLPLLLCVAIVLMTGGGGCARGERSAGGRTMQVLRVWSHQGQEAEHKALQAIVRSFNDAHAMEGLRVEVSFFPDFQYTEKLSIAAAAGDMPDAFELDGPLVARFVEAGWLAPLDAHVGERDRADFLPTLLQQGTVNGRLYALGAFDSAVVLYYDRDMLARAGVTPAPEHTAWTWEEFLTACQKLADAGMEPVSLHMDEAADEWYTYAFSPVVWSGGGSLVDTDGSQVRGVLASDANIRSLTAWQALFAQKFAQTDPIDPDLFGKGKVAMDWSGHWMARPHLANKGEKLGAMKLPRTGARSVAPCGSWAWAVSAHTQDVSAAVKWLAWVTHAEHGVTPMVRANGAVPSRRSAFAAFPEYSEIPYRLFREQLETQAQARPRIAAYATLTQRFAGALRDIARGADVRSRLQQAEDEIQAVIDRRHRRTALAP